MSKSFEGLLAKKKERKGECVRMSERVFERGNIFANILPSRIFQSCLHVDKIDEFTSDQGQKLFSIKQT